MIKTKLIDWLQRFLKSLADCLWGVIMEQEQNLHFSVKFTRHLDPADRAQLDRLFELAYEKANLSYLEKSVSQLSYIATARSEKALIGFAVADAVKTEVPRLAGEQVILLAGISCVHPDFRRQGLFRRLEIMAAMESGLIGPGIRLLACGRMAHPASFRVLRNLPSVIPKPGVPLTEWQREVGLKIAKLYDITIDPDTFIVKGAGAAIGYPKLVYEVADAEWLPFKHVNRDRGDSLLGMAWAPDAPEGW